VLLSFFCISLQAFGQYQKREIRGSVQDTSGIALEGVNVRLISSLDTLSATTDSEGRFVFSEVASLNFHISYSLLGYQIQDEYYSVNSLLPDMQIFNIKLRPQATVLKDVNIYGMLPILIKGDTIQYNARSYKIQAGQLVEDLMKQFPGIEINRSGLVKAQGQTITRVKVNGKDFFTGDVLTATRNLPADIVDNIQVIDDYGEQAAYTGIKSSEPERIININLKKDRSRGMFGQVTAGVGTDKRYIGSLSANNFDESQQISILGSTNNTNASLFSYGDVSGSGAREKSGADLNSMIEMNDGVNLTNSLGFNFRDDISTATSTYGGYVFTDRENKINSLTTLESDYRNNTILNREKSASTMHSQSHRLSWNYESKLDSSMYLKVSPVLSYGASNRFANGIGTINNRKLTTERNSNSEEKQRSPNLNLEAFFNKSFPRPGRSLSFSTISNFNSNNNKSEINDERRNIDSTNLVSPFQNIEKLNQLISNSHAINDFQFQTSYIEPITRNSFLEINYEFNYSYNQNNRKSNDIGLSSKGVTYTDSLFINYAYKFSTNKIGFLYQFNNQKYTYQLGFGFQPTRLSGYTFNREISTNKESINFVPNARFSYRINQLSSFSLIYKGRNNQPEFYQIQPIRDNSNPQYIIIGNSELQSEFINEFSLQYRNFNMVSGNAFFGNLSFKSIKNKIVTERNVIPNSTVQETGFTNTSGYFDTHAYYLYSLSLIESVFNININSTVDYNNNISFINQEKNKGRNLNFTQGLQATYVLDDWLNIDFRGNFLLSRIRNTLPSMSSTDVSTLSLGLGNKTYLKDWVISFDVAKRINNGYSDFKINPTLLNIYFEKAFGKNDRAVVRLQAFDLLNQNTGITREVDGNDTYFMKNDRLGRYFLISFNMRLQKFPN
jgi:hypothetical protein